MTGLLTTAKALFQAAVDRADPAQALRAQLASSPLSPLPEGGRNVLLAVGKAAVPMMREALVLIPGCQAGAGHHKPRELHGNSWRHGDLRRPSGAG